MALITQTEAARTYEWCLEYHNSRGQITGFSPFKLEKWARACMEGHRFHGGHGILMRRQDGPDGPEYQEVERF